MSDTTTQAVRYAISYSRFSSAKQEKGSSEERQQAEFSRFCQANNLTPFETAFIDRGKSGFKGTHREGDFGKILEMVESGSFPKNSVLVVENLDRFSREAVPEALATWAKIIRSGIDIGVCRNGRIFTKASMSEMDMIMVLLEMVMAHEHSAKLSKRMKESWNIRTENFKKGKRKAISTTCPAWMEWNEESQEFHFIEEKANTMRKACEMSIGGHGATEIRRQLGLIGSEWRGLTTMFRQRTLIGEYTGKNSSEPIQAYYPALLSENEFHQLQASLDSRLNHKAARGEYCTNLFTDLIFAQTGEKMVARKNSRKQSFLSVREQERTNGNHYPTIFTEAVETALLSCFIRLKPSDLQPKEMGKESEIEALQGRIAENKATTEQVQQRMGTKFNPALLDTLERLGNQRTEMEAELEALKRSEAVKNGSDFAQTQTLIQHLATLSGTELLDARVRLKSAIGQKVERITLEILTTKTANIRCLFKSGITFVLSGAEWERTADTMKRYEKMRKGK